MFLSRGDRDIGVAFQSHPVGTFRLNSHLERGGSSSLLILPGLLRSDLGGLSVSLLQENERTPVAYVGDVNSLPWNFISFPHKPSYSASFLH